MIWQLNRGRYDIQSKKIKYFIIDLLMQSNFHFAKLIGRVGEHEKWIEWHPPNLRYEGGPWYIIKPQFPNAISIIMGSIERG